MLGRKVFFGGALLDESATLNCILGHGPIGLYRGGTSMNLVEIKLYSLYRRVAGC